MHIAPRVICKLVRQQTRLLIDYLQVLLNVTNRSSLPWPDPQQAILGDTCNTLSSIAQPVLNSQTGTDNQIALSSFVLQLMLQQTFMKPLNQSDEFHRQPDFNFDQLKHSKDSLLAATSLVQKAMQCLNVVGVNSASGLDQMLDQLQHPADASKLPDPDDAAFLEPSDVLVHSILALSCTIQSYAACTVSPYV